MFINEKVPVFSTYDDDDNVNRHFKKNRRRHDDLAVTVNDAAPCWRSPQILFLTPGWKILQSETEENNYK